MTYAIEQSKLSRTRVDIVVITLDYCALTYGTAPCTAADSVKCFNTWHTCKDQTNYSKGTKDYKFINADLHLSVIKSFYPAKPYLMSVSDLPTEIKEKDTVTKRLKIKIADEKDNDVGVDPYRSSRPSIQGTFLKKLIARNPNYKGRPIVHYKGFAAITEAEFQKTFEGTIENITVEKGGGTIEAEDIMKKMSKIKYPLKQDIALDWDLGAIYKVNGQTEMLNLLIETGDMAQRTDAQSITGFTITQNGYGALLDLHTYYYAVYAYDSSDRVIASAHDYYENATGNDVSVDISWDAFSGASYYRIYFRDNPYTMYSEQTALTFTDDGSVVGTSGSSPTEAERYYSLSKYPASDVNNWTPITTGHSILLSDTSDLDSSGYVKIDKEIIYYSGKTSTSLTGAVRGMFDTSRVRHDTYSVVYAMLMKSPGNPFTHLKSLLALAGIDSSKLATNFTTYETNWSDINFSTPVIAKDSKLSEIYFDLVAALDCSSWQNEDGLIDIKYYTEVPASFTRLTDGENFEIDTLSVDLNEESKKTRHILHWNRTDVTKSLKDSEAYNRITIAIDTDAESANDANESLEDEQFTTWINEDCGTETEIQTYITDLLNKRRLRQSQSQTIITGTIEMKDAAVKTGDLVSVSTSKLEDIYGNDYADVIFRVVKKTDQGNKFKLKLKRAFSDEVYLVSEGDKYVITESSKYIVVKQF